MAQFDLLSKKDLYEICLKLNSGEYSEEYVKNLYLFSDEDVKSIKAIVLNKDENNHAERN